MSGVFPPGKTSPALCGLVLRNMLEAHVAVYQRLKEIMAEKPVQDERIKIGIVHWSESSSSGSSSKWGEDSLQRCDVSFILISELLSPCAASTTSTVGTR